MSDVEFIHWPTASLRPVTSLASQVAFSRSGGRSIGGIDRVIRTDKGYWRITLTDVMVWDRAMRQRWNAIRTKLNGRAGLIAVPAWSFDSAPFPSGEYEPSLLFSHDDETTFEDDTQYYEGAIRIEMAAYAPLSSTVVTLRLVDAASAEGIRFSYQHALYETGPVIERTGDDTFRVPIFPAIRHAIPDGAWLEVDNPTCLCRLVNDQAMDLDLNSDQANRATVEFVEAVEVWNDMAIEVA